MGSFTSLQMSPQECGLEVIGENDERWGQLSKKSGLQVVRIYSYKQRGTTR